MPTGVCVSAQLQSIEYSTKQRTFRSNLPLSRSLSQAMHVDDMHMRGWTYRGSVRLCRRTAQSAHTPELDSNSPPPPPTPTRQAGRHQRSRPRPQRRHPAPPPRRGRRSGSVLSGIILETPGMVRELSTNMPRRSSSFSASPAKAQASQRLPHPQGDSAPPAAQPLSNTNWQPSSASQPYPNPQPSSAQASQPLPDWQPSSTPPSRPHPSLQLQSTLVSQPPLNKQQNQQRRETVAGLGGPSTAAVSAGHSTAPSHLHNTACAFTGGRCWKQRRQ